MEYVLYFISIILIVFPIAFLPPSTSLITRILFSIPGVILYYILSLPSTKGFFGERLIRKKLTCMDTGKYIVLNDVILPSRNKTTQIDHLVISIYGIFVIETKNYSGWIFGNENSQYWTSVIYKVKNKFYNPIRQNYAHVMSLKDILNEFPFVRYFPIVVFNPKATLKIQTESSVIYTNQVLKEIEKHAEVNISQEDMQQIYKKIQSTIIYKKGANKEHVKNVQENRVYMDDKIRNNICLRCGGVLSQRKGKNGVLKGCSNYPKCRFTVGI